MKKVAMILFVFLAGNFFSQENLFQKIKEELKNNYPELKMENKLIMINIWSVNDIKSRETNIQTNKALEVYGGSKLKGGAWGIIGVLICKDENSNGATVILHKDKVTKPLVLNLKDEFKVKGIENVVYDITGKEIYKNVSSENVYESIHQLITR